MADAGRMGDVAAVDSYDPFSAEQFVNPLVDRMGRGLAQTVLAPGQLAQPNPYQPGGAQASDPYASELASWYDDQTRLQGCTRSIWGHDTALQMVGARPWAASRRAAERLCWDPLPSGAHRKVAIEKAPEAK